MQTEGGSGTAGELICVSLVPMLAPPEEGGLGTRLFIG